MNKVIEALFIGPTVLVAFLIFANLHKVNTRASRWFGTFILLVFIIELQGLLYNGDTNTHVLDVLSLANYVIAPVFYFSIVYYVTPARKWKPGDILHFLFGILLLLLTVLTFIVPADAVKAQEEEPQLSAKILLVFSIVFCLQVLPYCVVAYYKISKYQKHLLLYASSTEKVNLNWLKKVVVCVSVIAVLWLADGLFNISDMSMVWDVLSTIAYFTGICYIAYYSLKQKEVFPFNAEEKSAINTVINEVEATKETGTKKKLVTDEKLANHILALKNLMETEKPYLDGEISLISLAEQLNMSPHQLSYIINTGFEENFFQFINRYRIEEAKLMILDPKCSHLSLIGIAFEVGFNSKTVFNTTFKKITGKTPTEFKKGL